MARRKRQAFTNQFARPMTERDFGDAVRMMFSSREEIAEMFEGMEARLVTRMRRICEEAKRARDAEWPLPPEEDTPAVDDPTPPVERSRDRGRRADFSNSADGWGIRQRRATGQQAEQGSTKT